MQWADVHLGCATLPLLRTVQPHALVKVALDDLVDPAQGPGAAQMGFDATISAARARWVTCDADLTRIVLDPDGQPLDLGRTVRLVTPAIRRAVEHPADLPTAPGACTPARRAACHRELVTFVSAICAPDDEDWSSPDQESSGHARPPDPRRRRRQGGRRPPAR